jgi:hypothetical protein
MSESPRIDSDGGADMEPLDAPATPTPTLNTASPRSRAWVWFLGGGALALLAGFGPVLAAVVGVLANG